MRSLFVVISIMITVLAYSQPQLEATTSAVIYTGNKYSFSGNPFKYKWTDTTIAKSTGTRVISIDNSVGLDTLYFAFSYADTSTATRSRLYPGKVYNAPFYFLSNVRLFYRVPTDTTKPILIMIQ